MFTLHLFNLLAAGKYQYKSTSYKMQNLYVKSLDISGRVLDLTAGRYNEQPAGSVKCKVKNLSYLS